MDFRKSLSFKTDNSCKEDFIVIKHHPMDRGKVDYTSFIKGVCFNIKLNRKRVIYVYDMELPIILKGAKGCITINSTVGLQSLYHSVPLKVMGLAMYDIEGLTFSKSISEFWDTKTPVDLLSFKKYKSYIVNKTQITGSFFIKKF